MGRNPTYRDVQPVRDLVTEEDAMEAMAWLDSSPHESAEAFAAVDLHIALLRRAEADAALASAEKSNDRKLWEARTSNDYREAAFRLRDAQSTWKEMDLRRQVAMLKIELYRTICADKRQRQAQESENERAARRTY